VKSGESLGKIAKHYYDDSLKYKENYEANTNISKNPDLIHPNQVMVIPKV